MMIPGLHLPSSRAGTLGKTSSHLSEALSPQVYSTTNLKRLLQMLSGIPQPHVLDLARVSSPNIEWLIQKGFKVYVDDRISPLKPAPPPPASPTGEKKKPSPAP